MVDTAPDGDCFFHSLRGLINEYYGIDFSITELRSLIVHTLQHMIEENLFDDKDALILSMITNIEDFYEDEVIDELSTQFNYEERSAYIERVQQFYFDHMNDNGSWATELEIGAASYLLNRVIELRSERIEVGNRRIERGDINPPLVLYHVIVGDDDIDGNHYQYRRRLEEEVMDLPPRFNQLLASLRGQELEEQQEINIQNK